LVNDKIGGYFRAERNIGGNPETQKEFLEILESDTPKRSSERHRKKPPIANRFALGYTYQDVLDTDHEGIRTQLVEEPRA
jgi:dynein light intermediate chain 1